MIDVHHKTFLLGLIKKKNFFFHLNVQFGAETFEFDLNKYLEKIAF